MISFFEAFGSPGPLSARWANRPVQQEPIFFEDGAEGSGRRGAGGVPRGWGEGPEGSRGSGGGGMG